MPTVTLYLEPNVMIIFGAYLIYQLIRRIIDLIPL